MKKLLPILFILIITSCSKEIPSDQLVERGGITYQVNSQTPFTGTSIEYHIDTIIDNKFEEILPKNKIKFKNGVKDGLSESFYFNGQLQLKSNFKNGELDGPSERYYPNGQLSFKGTYKNGELDGLSDEYYEVGQVKEKSNYKDGLLDGPSESYLENGQLNRKINYKEGILKEIEYYDEKGNKVFFDITKRWIIDFSNHYDSNIYTFTPNGHIIDNDVRTPNKVSTTKENTYWKIDNRKLIINNNNHSLFEGFLDNDEGVEGVILSYSDREVWGTWTMKVYDEKNSYTQKQSTTVE